MFILLLIVLYTFSLLLKGSKTSEDQVTAVEGLIARVFGDKKYVSSFSLKIDPTFSSYFQVFDSNGKIGITSGNGMGLSSGLHYYIRYILHGEVSWETKYIPLDNFPVLPTQTITKERLGDYNYLFNVCAFGYTTTAWQIDDWEKLIDWAALHGVNLPLAYVGQEYIWYKTFETFGLSLEDMVQFFTGPHFLPWQRMGNIQKWGGPLPYTYLEDRYNLQLQILERMRSFGMTPVLPGFAGFVPPAFVQKFPDVKVTKSTSWGSFNSTYTGTYLLDALDPMFPKIGKVFYELLTSHFGTDHFYGADTFNEMSPKNSSLDYLESNSKAVYDAMTEVDEEAVWVMQGWLFYNERSFWTNDRIRAYLSSVPDDAMIILDLYSEMYPMWKETDSYFGKPFIWNMLKNFGGRRGLFGNVNEVGYNAIDDYLNETSTMVGFGITSEAIYLPPMPYEFLMDLYLQTERMSPEDVTEWLGNYVLGRYGESMSKNRNISEAWNDLRWGPFSYDYADLVWNLGVLEEYPRFGITPFSNGTVYMLTSQAFRSFVEGSANNDDEFTDGFMYDYVDVVRQFLSNMMNDVYALISYSYNEKRDVAFLCDEMLYLIKAMDQLLLTNEHFLLGTWIADARELTVKTNDTSDQDLYEFNARNQITLWGPLDAGIGGDYARKQWNGLVGDFYYTRWSIMFEDLSRGKYDHPKKPTDSKIDQFEVEWQTDFKTKYPDTPSGNALEIGKKIWEDFGDEDVLNSYTVMKGVDSPGNDIGKTYTIDPVTLASLCTLDADCKGFNANGWMKYDVQNTQSSTVDLYVKK